MARIITCTVCPLGCQVVLEMGENGEIKSVTGNNCARGRAYAEKEYRAPVRILTTTVRVKDGVHPLLPVRTKQPIPKGKLVQAMRLTADLVVQAPCQEGDLILADLFGLGIDLVASRDLQAGDGKKVQA